MYRSKTQTKNVKVKHMLSLAFIIQLALIRRCLIYNTALITPGIARLLWSELVAE